MVNLMSVIVVNVGSWLRRCRHGKQVCGNDLGRYSMACMWSIQWLMEMAEANDLKIGYVQLDEPVTKLKKHGWMEKEK